MTTSIGDTLAQYKIIPVLVLEDLESGLRRCELLCECGLPVAEITFLSLIHISEPTRP